MALNWTRDPFERLVGAPAPCRGMPQPTEYESLRRRLELGAW